MITDSANDPGSTKWWKNVPADPFFNGTYQPEAPETGTLTVNAPQDALVRGVGVHATYGNYNLATPPNPYDAYELESGGYYIYIPPSFSRFVVNDDTVDPPSGGYWASWIAGEGQGYYAPVAPATGTIYVALFAPNT